MKFLRRGNFVILLALLGGIFCFSTDVSADTSLFLSPATGRRVVGETFSIVVRVNTGGQPMNAAEGSIVFNNQKVEVVSISKNGSIFGLWTVDPTFSNAEGTIQFAGGLPSPGYTGSNGLILTITFRGISATTVNNSTSIILVSGAILANDGAGTNILTSLGRSAFFIGPRGSTDEFIDTIESTPSEIPLPTVQSKTHPEISKWYTSGNPEFSWKLPAGIDNVSYLVTQRPTSNPGSTPDGLKDSTSFKGIADGTWYFHIKFRKDGAWGPIAHYGFNVDTTAPDNLTVAQLESETTDPKPVFAISATDTASGIDRYEMKIDGLEWFVPEPGTLEDSYMLPVQKPGTYTYLVRVVDKANNTTETEGTFTVESIEIPVIEQYTHVVRTGEPIKLSGKGEAGNSIHLILQKNRTGELIRSETKADPNDTWNTVIQNMSPGTYIVHAYAEDERGATSLPSNEVSIEVQSPLPSTFFIFLRKLFTGLFVEVGVWFYLSLIFYLSLFLALFIDIIRRILRSHVSWINFRQRKGVRRNESGHMLKEYVKIMEQVGSIQGEVEKELDLLKGIPARRKLYPEEKYLKTKFGQYLKVPKKAKSK